MTNSPLSDRGSPSDEHSDIERILAMTDEECLAAGIAEYGSEEAWRAAMAALKHKMLQAAGLMPMPDPLVMRAYIDRLTRFYIDNPAWVALCEEARGYIGALAEQTQAPAPPSKGTPNPATTEEQRQNAVHWSTKSPTNEALD